MSKQPESRPAEASFDAGQEHALRSRGNALLEKGELDRAAACYAQALAINPDSAESMNSLGVMLYRAGRLDQSIVCYKKAVLAKPGYAEAHNNLAIALHQLGRLEEALAAITASLRVRPAFAAAGHTLGEILLALGNLEEAAETLRRVLEIQPAFVPAYLTLGNVLLKQGLLSQAIETYQRGLRLHPADANLFNNLAEAFKENGELERAAQWFRKALAAAPRSAAIFSNLLCLYSFTRYDTPEAEKSLAMEWEKNVLSYAERSLARKRASLHSGVFAASARKDRPLRLGFVSADLGSHAVAYFLEPVLEHLDRSRFHVSLFPTFLRLGPHSRRFQELADNYVALICQTDAVAADRIREERIDVLVDLTGHTFGGRLGISAHRAAPVQCAYLGYTGTTGLTEMDWIFSEPCLAHHFRERVWALPRLGVVYRGEESLPESSWLPDPTGTIWLGSLCRYNKIRRETLALWAKVLAALPAAKLLFEDSAPCQQETHLRILDTLSGLGVARNRVSFIPHVPGHERHMLLYNRLDIALDTIPLNGGTTSFDALWMGVPVVALEGDWTGGRLGYHVLHALGRPDWVAHSDEEYVSIVCGLAGDVEGRVRQRKDQRAQMRSSPLCDAADMTRCLEEAFAGMYDLWQNGASS